MDKAKDKALAYIEGIVIGIHTVKDMYTEEDTRKPRRLRIPTKEVLCL
jgi:hypothetical protein